MTRDHDHDHALGHHHHDVSEVNDGRLIVSIALNLLLTAVEVVAGVFAGSLSLLADAAHNFNDSAALLIAYIARRIARRGADARYTFGYRRAELIGAMINLTTLVVVALYLAYEAVMRLLDPAEVKGEWVMAAAGVALVVDVLTAAFLWAMSKGSLNVRAAFVHNLTDAAASVVVLAGGAAIWMGWPTWIDPLLTLGIAGYILYISWGMLQRTASILMENTPPDLAIDAVEASMREADGVLDVHHLHVWEIDEHHTALTAHVVAREPLDADALIETKAQIKRRLVDAFSIGHSTLEFEFEREDCMGCEASLAAAAPTTPPEQ